MRPAQEPRDDLDRRHAATLEAAIDGVISVDGEGRILEMNAAAERMFGWREAEVLGRLVGELLVPPEELAMRTERFRELVRMADGESTKEPVELTLRHRNGTEVRVQSTAARTTVDGAPVLIAFFHDLDADRLKDELAFSSPRLPLSERLPIVTYTNLLWPVATTVWMSPQAERITGYPASEWVGNRGFFRSVLHPGDRDAVLAEARASRKDLRPFSLDYRIVAPDGRVIWVHDESVPILDASGRLELIQGYFIDITERKQLEQQLLHSQKTEELGRLAGQIAHDFNNLLTAVRSYGELLLKRLLPATDEHVYAHEIVETTKRATELTQQLLAFGRRQKLEPRDLELTEVVRGLESLLTRVAGEGVAIGFELEPTPRVHADLGQLEQVLVNLVANARDAMPDGGLIGIGTYTTALQAGERADRLALSPGEYGVLAVSDTGHGMDAETKARVFEPFYTTKGRNHGTGLGLAIVDSVIRQNGGAIDLDSSPGEGTRFRILLPAVSG
ncbi:MAG TPA: PAS domain S-box protein [Gaiellaceae bacterium]|nr:PAS domain S-box protein [Gaiellaceae bacterium]